MMIRRITTTIAMTLAWAAGAAQTVAEPEEPDYPRYTVEVIIFEYSEQVSVGTEQFLPDEPPPEEELLLDEDGNPIIAAEEPAPVFSDEVVEAEAPPAWTVVLPASTPASEDVGDRKSVV